jgi:hypothetical protein
MWQDVREEAKMFKFIFGWTGYMIGVTVAMFVGRAVDPHAGYDIVIPVLVAAAFFGACLGVVTGSVFD